MKLGVLSDVHGNLVALDAVLADGATQGVTDWWVLGDLVAIGPEPAATLERLTSLPNVVLTRGNTERYTLTRDRPYPQPADVLADPSLLDLLVTVEGSFAWTRGALAATGWLDWLAALPLEARMTLPDGTRVLGVHASPGRDDGAGITPHRPDDELAAALAGADADLVLAGHTHQATDRHVGPYHAVNLGSLSNPVTDDPRATYVVLRADDDAHRVEHRWVAYDQDDFLRRLERSSHPARDFIASFQRREQIRFPAARPYAPRPPTAPSTT